MAVHPELTDRIARVVPHDSGWQAGFDRAAAVIRAAIGDALIALHHIGSTAIAGIVAKPVIDILGEAHSLAEIDDCAAKLEPLGYRAMGEYGIAGRRYFQNIGADGVRTHHLHIYESGSPHIDRHLAFRDYLRVHVDIARRYSELKLSLVGNGDVDRRDYSAGKAAFVEAIQQEALQWRRRAT